MLKYIKKPVTIEAVQWTGKFIKDAKEFTQKHGMPDFTIGNRNGTTGLIIPTLEGDHAAGRGDFIIKGIQGEYYPCKPDIFKATYFTEEEYVELNS